MTSGRVNAHTYVTLQRDPAFGFRALRCRTQTAFLFATLRAIFSKTFTSHTRIGIPRPQCPKLVPIVLSQDKAVAVLSQKAVVVELALR